MRANIERVYFWRCCANSVDLTDPRVHFGSSCQIPVFLRCKCIWVHPNKEFISPQRNKKCEFSFASHLSVWWVVCKLQMDNRQKEEIRSKMGADNVGCVPRKWQQREAWLWEVMYTCAEAYWKKVHWWRATLHLISFLGGQVFFVFFIYITRWVTYGHL